MAIDKEIQAAIARHVANAVSEVAALLQDRVARAIGLGVSRARGRGRPRNGDAAAKNVSTPEGRPGIAPSGKNPSKGPRFHVRCEKHMKAPKAQYSKWAEAARGRD